MGACKPQHGVHRSTVTERCLASHSATWVSLLRHIPGQLLFTHSLLGSSHQPSRGPPQRASFTDGRFQAVSTGPGSQVWSQDWNTGRLTPELLSQGHSHRKGGTQTEQKPAPHNIANGTPKINYLVRESWTFISGPCQLLLLNVGCKHTSADFRVHADVCAQPFAAFIVPQNPEGENPFFPAASGGRVRRGNLPHCHS